MKTKTLQLILATILSTCFAISPAAFAAEPAIVRFWAPVNAEWQHMVDVFNETHADIQVELENLGSDVDPGKFIAALATGQGPDVLHQNRHGLAELAAYGAFYPVDDLVARDGISADDWAPVPYREMFWDGVQYGLPTYTDTRFFYWNKDLFAQSGLNPDVAPATWNELEAYAPKLTLRDPDGQIRRMAFSPYHGNTFLWLYAWANNAEFFADPEHRIATPDHPKVLETLEWLVNYYDQYNDGFEASQQLWSAVGNAFVMERVAMLGGINTHLNQAARANFDWGTAPMPIPEGGTRSTWSCGFSLVMARTVRDVESAWTFVKWAAGPEGVMARSEALVQQQRRQWAEQGLPGQPIVFPRITTNRAAQELVIDAFIRPLGDDMQAHFALATDALNWTRGCGSEMAPVGYEYFAVMDEAARRALTHETTPQGALADAKRKIQAAVDAFYSAVEQKQ